MELKGKLPPQSIKLELAVLGAMLIDKSAIDDVMMIIKSHEVFYKSAHQLIFKAIQQLVKKSIGVDVLTLVNQLKSDGALKAAGGMVYIVELSQEVSSTAHVEYHTRIIQQQWIKREIIHVSSKQIENSYKDTVDVFDLVGDSEKILDEVHDMLDTGTTQVDFSTALQLVTERVELLSNQKEHELVGVTTGFKVLDSFTGGWQEDDLIVVAARPGMGKTSFILKNLLEIALNNDAVGMFSLEMGIQQLAARLVSINSNFHLAMLLKNGFEHDKYFGTLNKVVGDMSSLPIFIDDSAGISIHQLQMKARVWKRKHNIKALFVDYIQLMSGDEKSGNREQEISTITRKLKQLAKELKIPVIALSQLSRSVETRGGDHRPRLSDLRESGAIEQDADAVIFIYRPDYYGFELDEDVLQSGANTEISFAKYRAGSLETKGLWWQGDKTKFMDVEDKATLQQSSNPF